MKAGLVETPGVLKVVETDAPRVEKKDDVLIRVKRAGICGSDIHIYHGKNPFATYPRVWGHEFAGEVAEVGAAAAGINKGDRVVVEPIIYCGSCYACRQGRGNVCENLKVMGVHVDGGCREYAVVPASRVHVLPADLPWDEAALVEPFTIGAQACYRGGVLPGDITLVMGAGTIGLTVAVMAKLAGAKVIIIDIVEEKLRYAKQCGVDWALNAKECDVEDSLAEISGGSGANVVVDAICNKKSFEDAISYASAAGRVVELSFSDIPSEIAPMPLIKKEITVCGSRLQTRRFPEVIDFIKQKKLPLKGFVTKVYPLNEMAEAFDFVDKNNASVRKVLVNLEIC